MYVGKPFVLYEPRVMLSTIHGTPIVQSDHRMMPLILNPEGLAREGIRESLATSSNMETFLLKVPELTFYQCSLVPGCKSPLCDSARRGPKVPFNSRPWGSFATISLTTLVIIPNNQKLSGLPFKSSTLAKLFIDEDVLQVSNTN